MPEAHGHGRMTTVKKIARKPHTKSRNGCEVCKKRRIKVSKSCCLFPLLRLILPKCDEKKPQCSNCIRHESNCSFALQISQSSPESSSHNGSHLTPATPVYTPGSSFNTPMSTPVNPALLPGGTPQLLNMKDLELMHNFNTSTSLTIANEPGLQTFMRITAPKFGFSHPFVMHAVLAVSALHLSRYNDSSARYLAQAQSHYDIALRAATALLPNMDEETSSPLWLFTTFCIFFTLGMGPKEGDFLLFGNQGLAEWHVLFRGLLSILKQNWVHLSERSELAPIFSISIRMLNREPNNHEQLQWLKTQILATSSDDSGLEGYLKALEDLSKSFAPGPAPGSRMKETSPQHVFTWMHGLSDEFVINLQHRKPVALAILSFFCVLLNDLNNFWWMRDWPAHLMSEIYASLNGEYRMWLRWPMEEIGWIPG